VVTEGPRHRQLTTDRYVGSDHRDTSIADLATRERRPAGPGKAKVSPSASFENVFTSGGHVVWHVVQQQRQRRQVVWTDAQDRDGCGRRTGQQRHDRSQADRDEVDQQTVLRSATV